MIRLVVLGALLATVVPHAAAAPPPLALEPCVLTGGLEARCGRLTVPENRALASGRIISLRVAVLPARDGGSNEDPLVYLAGGPGGSAIANAAGIAGLFDATRATRDIVLIDQRGTGGSGGRECPAPQRAVTRAEEVRQYVERCLAGLDIDSAQYTTVPAMDDLAAVLAALGYEQVNLYGVSYGATAAQYFVAQHPDLVRTVILDGGTLLDMPIFELWGRNGQRALKAVLARCAAAPRCARAYPRARREAFEVIDTLRRRPVRTLGTRIDAATAAGAIQALTRTPDTAATIPWIAHRARVGDWAPLALAIDDAGTGITTRLVTFWSIVCSEPWARWNPQRTAVASRGTYLAERTRTDAALTTAICRSIPKAPQPAWSAGRIASVAPVLFLAGGADPQDPPANIAGARASLPNSRTVVVPAGGHVVLQLGCTRQLATRFIESGDAGGLDTSCVNGYKPPPFVVR